LEGTLSLCFLPFILSVIRRSVDFALAFAGWLEKRYPLEAITTPEQTTPLKKVLLANVGGRHDSGSPTTLPAISTVAGSGPKSLAGSGGITIPASNVSGVSEFQLIVFPPSAYPGLKTTKIMNSSFRFFS
jgi:hypothetical protein